MKTILTGLFTLSILFMAGSCASSNPGYINKLDDYSNYTTLAEALKSVSGVKVTDGKTVEGEVKTTVYLKGTNGSNLQISQPLYVINDVPVGKSYNDANSIVNMKEVTSIRILTGTYALTKWGDEGSNGVILIKTKAPSDTK